MNPQQQFFPNMGCCDRGKVGAGNITIHSQKEQRYFCKTCEKTFSATTGTARQVEAGAEVIDVTVQAADVLGHEPELLVAAVEAVASVVDAPISVDTNDRSTMPAALKNCPGRPLVNSVTGEEESLERVLPLVAEHHACVIAMPADDDGIPTTDPHKRLEIARKIVLRAEQYGIAIEDILVDVITLPIGAEPMAAAVALKTARLIREELGMNLTSGASNVSFGMPRRPVLNAGYLAVLIAAGINARIVDPSKAREIISVADLLTGRDEFADRFLTCHRLAEAEVPSAAR